MDRCSPTQLLLYRFNPKCNSNDLVQLATSKLFAKVKAYQDGMTLAHTSSALSQALKRAAPVPQDEVSTAPAAERPKVTENDAAVMIGLNSCEAYGLAEGEGEVDMGAGEPRLILSEDAAQIVDCDGKEVCLISISLISEVECESVPSSFRCVSFRDLNSLALALSCSQKQSNLNRKPRSVGELAPSKSAPPTRLSLRTTDSTRSARFHLWSCTSISACWSSTSRHPCSSGSTSSIGARSTTFPAKTSLLLRLSFPPRGRPSRPGDYEDMQDYVAAFLQIRRARSLIDRAYSRVLQEALYPAQSRGDPDRRLANNRVQVIEKLRTHLREFVTVPSRVRVVPTTVSETDAQHHILPGLIHRGDNFFSESRQSLIQVPHFAPSDFGPDVYDSFRRSLDRIVQTEKDILHR